MEFLQSFLRNHLAGKPVVASPNVGCFLRLSAGLVDPVLNLYDGLVKFFREFSYRKTVINPAHQKFSTSFSFLLNVGLDLGQVHQKTILKQHWKRQRQVSQQYDPSGVSMIVELYSLPKWQAVKLTFSTP